MSTVLVTGGSGYVGGHAIVQLLEAGHRVRTTVRSAAREAQVRAMVEQGGVDPGDRLAIFIAALDDDDGWAAAMAGCDYVLHVASPFPPGEPENEDMLIIPARDGVLRVLRAARDAGVKRVVMTSSFAAIGYGHAPRQTPFDETDWTNLDGVSGQAYAKSKVLAERAAWDFVASEGGGMELTVIHPVAIFGPVLGPPISTTVNLIKMLLEGAMPAVPEIHFGVVDVRDVANLHIIAMTHPAAAGERLLALADSDTSYYQLARILRAGLGAAGKKVPRHRMPRSIIRFLALFDKQARHLLPQVGLLRSATSAKAKTRLGWTTRPIEETVIATGESLIRLGMAKVG